jgi:hypothetical protein
MILPLLPLRSAAGLFETKLLSFHGARIAAEKSCFFESLPKLGVKNRKRACNSHADSFGLGMHSPAFYLD